MKKTWITGCSAIVLAGALGVGGFLNKIEASDHDDGDNDIKSRALNLTDHFAFKSPTAPDELALIMYFSPRSLPGRQYFMSTNARYEFHVSKAASKTAAPTGKDDFVYRFEAKAPDMTGVQDITLTVLENGAVKGTVAGKSTDFANSKANTIVTNMGNVGGSDLKYFVGMRADSFYFDVNRFFQVRAFLAARFFGGAGGNGLATASLANNCAGQSFLQAADPDVDKVNLFNPPSCAPDFTKNLNVVAIVLNVKIASLGGGTVFDTWSTISVKN